MYAHFQALSTSQKSELILKEVKHVDGVDVNIKLENLGGSRRRISGGLIIEVCAFSVRLCSVLPYHASIRCSRYLPNTNSHAHVQAPPRAIWDVLTNYNQLHEYIPNIAASGAQLQPNGRVRIEQVFASRACVLQVFQNRPSCMWLCVHACIGARECLCLSASVALLHPLPPSPASPCS